jgi:hypothetical protein
MKPTKYYKNREEKKDKKKRGIRKGRNKEIR